MKYVSTRGHAPAVDFETALTAGLAPDGGLYMPVEWPRIDADTRRGFAGASYSDVAAHVLCAFTGGSVSRAALAEMAHAVFDRFADRQTAPLTQVGDEDWILELYHGPTLAFKDFAMQLLGQLFDAVLSRTGRRLTIMAATSGDTGAAAIHALAPCRHVDVVVLHPKGRVTPTQRRMMTTVEADNVLNIAVEGDFDMCQAIVKTLFADRAFVDDVALSGVNSINWARLAAQSVYYFTAVAAIGARAPVNFVVPTGNFGDVFAGYGAARMGLDVGALGVATNENDILHRVVTTGVYAPDQVRPTISPSMDIQVASNFERLLFDAMDRDADAVRAMMERFATTRSLTPPAAALAAIRRDFVSYAASEAQTRAEMRRHHDATGALIDPHTAVGRVAARALREAGALHGPTVTLATAHPAKFPDAVAEATGVAPALPAAWSDLFERAERMTPAPADASAVAALVQRHVNRP